jgi:hypothetical protein
VIARVARLLVKLALLGLVLWVSQRAWTRWVNGPKVEPSSTAWPPVGGAGSGATGAAGATGATGATTANAEAAAPTEEGAAAPADEAPAPEAAAPAAKAAAPAKRAAKKATPAKTAPGKIVAASTVRTPGKKAGQAAGAPPAKAGAPASKRTASARIVPADKGTAADRKWLPPEGDACPPTHQVKAKLSSMIYHLPGMAAYARTTPDRCYATAEDAEEDGFARAKR